MEFNPIQLEENLFLNINNGMVTIAKEKWNKKGFDEITLTREQLEKILKLTELKEF